MAKERVLLPFFFLFCMPASARHECERECRLGDTRICKYEFHLELYHTLSRACHGCPNVTADCYRPDCISGDGRPRPVTVVNRRLPGPAIQVCEGDEIQVLVKNGLISETTTIHWHGIHQSGPGAAWMDGVPHVTQCPILPGTSFLYSFRAHPAGSHFWHSHSGVQRGDGVYGALAVRRARIADPLASHYDEDADFLVLADWLPETSVANFASHHHASGDNKPDGILVNGRGWPPRAFPYRPSPFRPVASLPPLANVTVKPGKRHRIRVIGNGVLNCPLEMLIDDHPLTVVATDGFPVRPFVVDSLVVYAGERTDVVVKADREPGTYWIRIRGHIDCGVNFTRASQVALLVYEGAESLSSPFPSSPVGFRYFPLPNRTYNGVNEGPGKVEEGRWTASETTWIGNDGDLDPAWRKPDPDRFFLLTFDFYPVPHSSFYHQEHYPVFTEGSNRLYTPQVNHISLELPPGPLLAKGREPETRHKFCNLASLEFEGRDCKVEYCHCLHVLSVPKGSVVDVLLVDEGTPYEANHPFHLHGNHFRVLGMGKTGRNTSRQETEELIRRGEIRKRLEGAPFKDTVTVPDGGYTLIRFLADNPGYWLMHCHLDYHMELGMGLVWEVGDPATFPHSPRDFPQCGDYLPSPSTENGTTTTTTETATTEDEEEDGLLTAGGGVAPTFHLLVSVSFVASRSFS